jgi:RNA polymerase sigma factor (sigma-70 family)
MIGDKELIRQYAAERSEAAFAELVRRHLKMVYAAALRQVNGDTHLAEDVAQSVFADLARKAGRLQQHGSIAGWLYASTRFLAANAVRGEARRRAREQAVVSMNEMNSNANAGWSELGPMMDEALGELGETDREAIVLRYFESYEFSLVGTALGVSENAARMRVDRALEKLRAVLQKRGRPTTGAALACILVESSSPAVPAQLAAGITGAAMITAGAPAFSSAPSIVKVIAMKKLSLAAIGVLSLSLAAVLVIRNLPDSNPQAAAAASPPATQAPPVQLGGPAPSSDAKGNPDILKEIVQRYDERARARQVQGVDEARARWDKELADFENAMKEEPGVKKFGAARQVSSIGPNQTVIMGGWQTQAGERLLVFITPRMIDAAGNKVDPPFSAQTQVQVDAKFVSAPEQVLVKLGLQSLFTEQNDSTGGVTCSAAERQSYLNAIEQSSGGNILSSPRVTTSFGNQATVSVQETQMIAGKNQALGPSLGLLPTLSADGVSLDLDATALYTMAVNGAGQ